MLDTSRARPIFDPRNPHSPVLVAGVGATGSHVVALLVAYGVNHITFVDDDTVAPHNLPNQIFMDRDVGIEKVHGMFHYIQDKYRLDQLDAIHLDGIIGKLPACLPRVTTGFRAKTMGMPNRAVIFLCVDSMAARKEIVDALYKEWEERQYPWWVIDTRMASTHGNLFSFPIEYKEAWEATLIRDEDAEMSPCGAAITCASTTFHTAAFAWEEYLKLHVDPEAMEQRINFFLKPLYVHTEKFYG